MKARSQTSGSKRRSTEFKGVVKHMAGKLTSNPALEQEGKEEMMGGAPARGRRAKRAMNPDPHRRG